MPGALCTEDSHSVALTNATLRERNGSETSAPPGSSSLCGQQGFEHTAAAS